MCDDVLKKLIEQLSGPQMKLTAKQQEDTEKVLAVAKAQLMLPVSQRYTRLAVLLHEAQKD